MSKTSSESPNRQAAIKAAKSRDYMIGFEEMTKRYENGWYQLGDRIGTPSIDYNNPYDPEKQAAQWDGFEDAKKRLGK